MFSSLAIAVVLAIAGCAALTWRPGPRRDPARPDPSPASGLTGVAGPASGPGGTAALGAPDGLGSLGSGLGSLTATRPALVNFVLTRCTPGAAAYQATILDLAARGFLAARDSASGLWLELPGAPAGPRPTAPRWPSPGGPATAAALSRYEQQVLGDMRARLAGPGGAPFQALAEACTADVPGTWEPFEAKLRAEARRGGLSRPALPATGRTALQMLAGTAVIAVLAFLVARGLLPGGASRPGITSGTAVIVFWCGLGWLGRQDRLTAAGAALASRWKQARTDLAVAAGTWPDAAPAGLEQRAFAVAAGAAHRGGTGGLLGPGIRSTALPSPAGRGVIHQGDAGALTLIVASGRIADINLRHARKYGLPLPGAGDEAWLINRGRASAGAGAGRTADREAHRHRPGQRPGPGPAARPGRHRGRAAGRTVLWSSLRPAATPSAGLRGLVRPRRSHRCPRGGSRRARNAGHTRAPGAA